MILLYKSLELRDLTRFILLNLLRKMITSTSKISIAYKDNANKVDRNFYSL